MKTIIVKNDSGSEKKYVGKVFSDQETYEVSPKEFSKWADDSTVTSDIQSGDLIINNGIEDLHSEVALEHLQSNVQYFHDDISLYPAVGQNSPELVEVNNLIIGHCIDINEVVYGQTRFDDLIGNTIKFQMHFVINNAGTDRYVRFDVKYRSTGGRLGDKDLSTIDGTIDTGNIEVPNGSWKTFDITVDIPTSAFDSGENYLLIAIERKTATGETAPANHPVLWRYCRQFYKKIDGKSQ